MSGSCAFWFIGKACFADALASLLHQQPDGIELVVTREDHRFGLHLAAVVVAFLFDL